MNNTRLYKLKTNCRCCNNPNLDFVLDLGDQPLANSYCKTADEVADTYPLSLMSCSICSHMQLSVVVDPDALFKNYLYVSGTTDTLRKYFEFFAKYSIEKYNNFNGFKKKAETVLDIACNDGSLLNAYKPLGLKTYGVDPATNLLELSSVNHDVRCEYLNCRSYSGMSFDIITAQNVIAHTDDVHGFLMNCKRLLSDEGLLFVQVSQSNMVENNEFDTIYHEHCSYFTDKSMATAAEACGLKIVEQDKFSIHGISRVYVMTHSTDNRQVHETYRQNIYLLIGHLKRKIARYQRSGYKLVGYGAAAKGMTLLGFSDLEPEYIVDDNPLKVGLFAPYKNIPIVSIETLKAETHEKLLIIPLAWNFFDEIQARIKKVRNNKEDLFIKYFPEVEIQA